MNKRKVTSSLYLWCGGGISLAVLALYAYVYWAAPFPTFWVDLILNLIMVGAAVTAATMATHLWRQFAPTDRPRAIWRPFVWGLWLWAMAEVVWTIYAQALSDVPLFSLTDVFWTFGYLFLATALVRQSRLVFRTAPGRERAVVAGTVLGVLLLSLASTAALLRFGGVEEGWIGTFLSFFYPFADLALAVAALSLARTFGGGLWARPWLALLAFAVADALYASLVFSGVYAVSSEAGSPLSMIADTVYVGAYLVLALAFYSQFLLVRNGP